MRDRLMSHIGLSENEREQVIEMGLTLLMAGTAMVSFLPSIESVLVLTFYRTEYRLVYGSTCRRWPCET